MKFPTQSDAGVADDSVHGVCALLRFISTVIAQIMAACTPGLDIAMSNSISSFCKLTSPFANMDMFG